MGYSDCLLNPTDIKIISKLDCNKILESIQNAQKYCTYYEAYIYVVKKFEFYSCPI